MIGLCNPGKGDDLNRIYQNPELARKRWEQDFAAVLAAKLDELMAAPDSAPSPIFEAVQAVAVGPSTTPSTTACRNASSSCPTCCRTCPEKD